MAMCSSRASHSGSDRRGGGHGPSESSCGTENPDIMDEFLSNDGKSRAIPVFVFYTADLQYITHFTERSASAHAGLALAKDQAIVQLNLPKTATFGNLPDAERQMFLREVITRIKPLSDQWRKDAIKEIRELLSTALKVPNGG